VVRPVDFPVRSYLNGEFGCWFSRILIAVKRLTLAPDFYILSVGWFDSYEFWWPKIPVLNTSLSVCLYG